MFRHALFWSAFPWVLPQALWVKKTATRFPGAQGNNHGRIGEGEPFSLLAVGDSIAAGVGADTFKQALVGQLARSLSRRYVRNVNWHALGLIGATTQTVRERLIQRIPTESFDLMVVSAGVNDVTALTRLSVYEQQLRSLLATLHAHSPNAIIVLNGLPPMHEFPLLPQPLRAVIGLRSRMLESVVKRVSADHAFVVHVPIVINPDPAFFAQDGYHPSASGYAEFARAIADRLEREGFSGPPEGIDARKSARIVITP